MGSGGMLAAVRPRPTGVTAMFWVVGGLVVLALIGGSSAAVSHHLDRKAAKLQQGSEEDRVMAGELRDLSRQMDQGRYLYPH